jgi:hypothetical protein
VVGRERGYFIMEIVVALAVVGLIASAVFVGEQAQLRQVARSFDELLLSRAAAARLEALGTPEPGERDFEVPVGGASGRETVELLAPGLYEVVVTVRRGDHEVRLVTLVATEARR